MMTFIFLELINSFIDVFVNAVGYTDEHVLFKVTGLS